MRMTTKREKLNLVWVEQLTVEGEADVPEFLVDNFHVRHCAAIEGLDAKVAESGIAAVFFEFDYPDRRRLAHFKEFKSKNPSIPVVMITLQHSESLAVWAYRNGALDYLIKPVDETELKNCVDRITRIADLQRSQRNREAKQMNAPIPSDVPHNPRSTKDRLSPAIYYVQQHYSQKIYSDAMARLCDMSPANFSRMFRKTYDVTFQEFLLRYRVQQACRQFQGACGNIADVAYNVGFSDPSYFTRVFKRYVGMAPSEFSAANDPCDAIIEDIENSAEELTSGSQIVRSLNGTFSD